MAIDLPTETKSPIRQYSDSSVYRCIQRLVTRPGKSICDINTIQTEVRRVRWGKCGHRNGESDLCGKDIDGRWPGTRLVYQSARLSWLAWINSFFFRKKWLNRFSFFFQVRWLVTESIRFYKAGDWVDWLWETVMTESIELIPNIPKNVDEIEHFPKKINEIERFQKNSGTDEPSISGTGGHNAL